MSFKTLVTKITLGIAIFVAAHVDLGATHVLGGDIQYTCVGSSSYDLVHRVYRDCGGINLGATQDVDYQSGDCGVNTDITLTRTSIQEISPLCPTEPSACGGGSGTIGIEMHTYQGTLNLPGNCGDWMLSYRLCCRSNAITNLINGNSDAIYFEVALNDTVTPCNNSPVFNEEPLFFGCQGDTVSYDLGAVDPDGDSLSFQLMDCLENPGDVVEYSGGYSGASPMTSPSTLVIDPVTGIITIDAQVLDVSAVCVRIFEYRNGVQIGQTVRDFSVYIINCANESPELTGINGGTADTIGICTGGQTCIDIIAGDPDASDTVVSRWNGTIGAATFTPGPGGNPDTSTLCWTPTMADTGFHDFTVTTEDNGCPVTLPNSRVYVVEVLPCIMNELVTQLWVQAEEEGNHVHWNIPPHFYSGSFQLERSTDELDYEVLKVITPHGEDSNVEYFDLDMECNQTYAYRVRYTAPDNSEMISNTVTAEAHSNHCKLHISLFPTPAHGDLHFEWDGDVEAEKIQVFDMMGRVLLKQNISSSSSHVFDVSSFRPGKYILDVKFAGGYHAEKGFTVN